MLACGNNMPLWAFGAAATAAAAGGDGSTYTSLVCSTTQAVYYVDALNAVYRGVTAAACALTSAARSARSGEPAFTVLNEHATLARAGVTT